MQTDRGECRAQPHFVNFDHLAIKCVAEHARAYLAQPRRHNLARAWRGSFDGRLGGLPAASKESRGSLTVYLITRQIVARLVHAVGFE